MIQLEMIYLRMELVNIKKNKIINILILIIFIMLLYSCGEIGNDNKEKPIINNEFPSELMGIANNKKVYLTSFGQSKEVEDLNLFLFKNKKIEYYQNNNLQITDVEEDAVVFAVVGCSIKGLEAQNTTLNEEIIRCSSFVEANKNGNITLITWHLGGMARRGTTSDEIIKVALSGSTLTIFVTSGNEDNYLSDILDENNIPSYEITSITLLNNPINYLYSINMEEK